MNDYTLIRERCIRLVDNLKFEVGKIDVAKRLSELQGANTEWAKKPGLFFRVDNFATVNGRKAHNVKSFVILSGKNTKLARQDI